MDYRLLILLISVFLAVKCQNVTETGKTTQNGTLTAEKVEKKPEEETPLSEVPSMCTVCNCTGDIIDCDNTNFTVHFEDWQWSTKIVGTLTFRNTSLIHVKPFPRMQVRKLILRENKITKIDVAAFKQIINLTELDLSYNQLTTENLQPNVFEGNFSPDLYEPLEKLAVLNLANNLLLSLHQDIFEHLSYLRVLNLSGNRFSIVDRSTSIALSSLPDLEALDLSYCGLKTLPTNQFLSMRLRKLDLSGNQFANPPKALEGAKWLEVLYMDENPIQMIHHMQQFPRIPQLKELSLCCMPYLTVVGASAFSGLTSLERLRVENCPKLELIDPYALASEPDSGGPVWPHLKKLDLSNNALRYLPQQFLARWDWLEELDLMNNKWSCDCDNQYLIGMLLPSLGKKLMGDEMYKLTCAAPPEHAGKNLTSLSHRKLRCLDLNGARPERDATILIGILCGLLLAIPVCLTIFILWRRGFFFCGAQGPASFSRAFYKRARNDDEF
ncbi:PREDICTED: leucine-rich repeat neuronal protein 2-like isoform X2 [Habropoda laboriosa]|uniref:leucine-rich repeat neuronal protein 2-like isoform X2 n=1 Tax=Habropoda laboriosa TaxID=597456 RepID=UPI00083CC2CE|nr:PREDICTED: leucine-rich repeat neuronal protein 2-like isoform X2 [Habropoda laboriosa]